MTKALSLMPSAFKKAFRLSPFAFHLPTFSLKNTFRLLPFAFCLIMVASCTRNPDMQEPGDSKLQGEWKQDSVPAQKSLVTYSLYDIKFSCDSFLLKISTVSKVNYGADTCMSKGHWDEYIRGTYSQRQDTLHIKGQFCNADGSYKNEQGCFRFGDYEEYFKVHRKGDSLIRFVSTSNVIPINAHLIKRTSCIPKPL
ncbi:fumarate hydratase [Mucilaginibacter sp. cycad4]|uniref:fumarate hydratase n=1 Tax=Mucilaginibacter sp. cycad4 TaxID=3342096 RepID=UPI002AABF954|nr:fumarate hydratase [Mucilaginibacter gossypii]WPU99520.1 fumarate hydratase [Mucilaginibacter gossypii]